MIRYINYKLNEKRQIIMNYYGVFIFRGKSNCLNKNKG